MMMAAPTGFLVDVFTTVEENRRFLNGYTLVELVVEQAKCSIEVWSSVTVQVRCGYGGRVGMGLMYEGVDVLGRDGKVRIPARN